MATPVKNAKKKPRQANRISSRTTSILLIGFSLAVLAASLVYRHIQQVKIESAIAIVDNAKKLEADTVKAKPAKPPAVPYTTHHLYSETADPRAEIAAALRQARAQHKRVIVDFGGDWCGDCQVLDIYFHQPPNLDLLQQNFVIVHVFIGQIDKNLDIPEGYGIAIHKGVPALAVLDSSGKVLYSQKTGEFEDMRHMNVQSVTDFLNKWKA